MDKAMKDFLPRNPPSLHRCGCGINRHKKNPPCGYWHEGLHPAFLALSRYYRTLSIAGFTAFTKAGLLAFGSFYSLRLPVSLNSKQWHCRFRPRFTAAGPLPILTDSLSSPSGHLWLVPYPNGSFLSNAKTSFPSIYIYGQIAQDKKRPYTILNAQLLSIIIHGSITELPDEFTVCAVHRLC